MINRVVLVGRLTKDPDLRYTPNGAAVANFTIAVNRPFTNQQGDHDADFIPVVVWRRQAENTANFVGKGSLVGVEGRIQTRSYDNNEGRRVFVTEVVADSVQFLESRNARANAPANNNFSQQPGSNTNNGYQQPASSPNRGYNDNNPFGGQDDPFADDGKPIDISDDDLPF
ncbi:single-strand DNA-binding protein [Pullulanibacillus pueri]|uniref:Single-stranded DNA-binding protein n=1 Tax=Pullulanibacillus pueri TaxID=1437324 RepID=A0A8J2ZVD1_9BACL|nr:single-stranded DNA-binding protein [Pullulanibacillus pueri]MBM7682183.1 single-strand DNA-binding protein [Pullulanibacillus pueri]GGH80358.1 single-stranded DNA-binding protein [Pullulanibacillus pueri]